jgi:site-specific recombinase XerD
MQTLIETWRQQLTQQSALHTTTIIQYTHDVRRFAAWMDVQARPSRLDDVTVQDAKDYRNHLLGQGGSPATSNRALISLTMFLDAFGRAAANPFRKVDRVEVVAHPPRALTYDEWLDVRQAAERIAGADHHLAHALVCLMRYAGPRVGEVAALELPDVQISSRRGRLTIRRGKGLKHREVPLIAEVRDPLQEYLLYRKDLSARWEQKARARGNPSAAWARWPDGHLFLGQRGP